MQSSFVNKKAAKENGNVEYCESTVLYSSSKHNITLLPFFIRHSDPNAERDLSIKLTKNKLASNTLAIPESEINLNQEAVLRLREKLNEMLALKKIPDNGNLLIIKLGDNQQTDLSGLDSTDVAKAVIAILEDGDIAKNIDAVDFSDNLAFAFRHSIRIKSLIKAINQLEIALNTIDNEQYYQEWCQNNGWIFGNQYVMTDSERSISRNDKVDFLATSVITGFRDIIELKKPALSVLQFDSSHESYYFASDVSKAIGQCHRYLDVLTEDAAQGLRDNPEIVAYHPRATIIIGRSNDWSVEKHKALHGLNSRLSNISILTYDHLLAQGKRLIEMLQNPQSMNGFDDMPFDEEDGELPF